MMKIPGLPCPLLQETPVRSSRQFLRALRRRIASAIPNKSNPPKDASALAHPPPTLAVAFMI